MKHKMYSMLLACTTVLVFACSNSPNPNNVGCTRYRDELQAYKICEANSGCKFTPRDAYDRVKVERRYNEWCVVK